MYNIVQLLADDHYLNSYISQLYKSACFMLSFSQSVFSNVFEIFSYYSSGEHGYNLDAGKMVCGKRVVPNI